MINTEEAEIKDNGDVIIRYYHGRTVVIPRLIVNGSLEKYLKWNIENLECIPDLNDFMKGKLFEMRQIYGMLGGVRK
jgi:hypothetical protein